MRDDGLNERQGEFVVRYTANGGNATRAYLAAYPNCKAENTAAVEGRKLLRNPQIQIALTRERTRRYKRLRMDGDEALALISLAGRSDPALLYDKTGKMLPVSSWPKWLRLQVKSIKPGPFGDTVVFYDALRARELMATANNVLKNTLNVNHTFDHKALLGDECPEGDD